MPSLTARLLLSGPALYDPNFRHTVVLLGGHEEGGAFGVILNRPSEFAVADVFPPLAPLAGLGAMVYVGGPVQPEQAVMLAELRDPTEANVPVFGNIGFVTGEIPESLRPSIVRARVFAGYSGWGAGQLEAELAEDAWILESPRETDVFDSEPQSLWRRILERKGPQYRQIAMMPFDPRVN